MRFAPALLSALLPLSLALAQSPPAPAVADPSGPAPSSPCEFKAQGRSGALRALVVPPGQALEEHLAARETVKQALACRWRALGSGAVHEAQFAQALQAPARSGVWRLIHAQQGEERAPVVITSTYFDGSEAYLNGYHIGRYPAQTERRPGAYAPPVHFIEVTRENQDLAVSEHFRLRQFLTKDQVEVWPKYLVLDLRLVDKLELVIQELRTMGFPAKNLHVMSGYRTPQYNGPGGKKGKGRAKFSRHTYGDAADVWVDDDGDGQMDDLNGDGRLDVKDAEVLASVVDRVEQREPALIGGHGVYKANSAHGPFVHVDVRGTPARWSSR